MLSLRLSRLRIYSFLLYWLCRSLIAHRLEVMRSSSVPEQEDEMRWLTEKSLQTSSEEKSSSSFFLY